VAMAPHQPEPIRILHLSDLHLGPNDDPLVRLQPLVSDLQDNVDGLGLDHIDYLVASGDLTNRASVEEFEKVYQFFGSSGIPVKTGHRLEVGLIFPMV
jgi:3',5'-cyclic AMP phosphodiesterase CpdA